MRPIPALLATLVLLFQTAIVRAQCVADINGDGMVTAAEIVQRVRWGAPDDSLRLYIDDVFGVCQPTCRLYFTDSTETAGYSCLYHGSLWGKDAGQPCVLPDIDATWTSDGEYIVVTLLNIEVAPFPGTPGGIVHFGGTTQNGARAGIIGWWTDVDRHVSPLYAYAKLSGGASITMSDIGDAQIYSDNCLIHSYSGAFVRPIPVGK